MGLLQNLRARFCDDYCDRCKTKAPVAGQRLFALPMTVGNYCSHKDASYYLRNLHPVSGKADIPAGYYACNAIRYRCADCGRQFVKLSIFLPVREQEKFEESLLFREGELNEMVP